MNDHPNSVKDFPRLNNEFDRNLNQMGELLMQAEKTIGRLGYLNPRDENKRSAELSAITPVEPTHFQAYESNIEKLKRLNSDLDYLLGNLDRMI